MLDRSKYQFEYAPPAEDLIQHWTKELPSSPEIEGFFLNELCESSEHEYFLAVSDLFYDVVTRQEPEERNSSLSILWYRLYKAAEVGGDEELTRHYAKVLERFAALYATYLRPEATADNASQLQNIRLGALVLNALTMGDQPLARVIANNDIPLSCHNSDCDHYLSDVRCPQCDADMIPYEHHSQVLHGC